MKRSDGWKIDESDFYELEKRRDQIEFLLRYAVLAPSSRNTQPWSFKVTDDGVEVYVDYTRRLPIADADDRELLLSVGAAITNFRVAAAHFGLDSTVLYQARPEESLPIAVVALRETCATDAELRRLFGAIMTRRTNRGTFDGRPIDDVARAALCGFVDDQTEFIRFIVPHDRQRAADLVSAADRILFTNEAFRDEMTDWVRDNETSAGDGMCVDNFGPRAWFLRRLRNQEAIQEAAGLLVVTADDDRIPLVRAGEVLERLLLLLTTLGLQYSFINEPIEVSAVRKDLWSMIRSPRPPQLLLRIGYGRPIERPQPRRPVEQVVT